MKTNFYILLILLFSFSFGNAQSENSSIEVKTNSVISVSEMNDEVSVDSLSIEDNKEETVLLINAAEVKEAIARTNSDIRIYLNRMREKKVDNIKILFPQINKAIKA